jgi:hypothetical protein
VTSRASRCLLFIPESSRSRETRTTGKVKDCTSEQDPPISHLSHRSPKSLALSSPQTSASLITGRWSIDRPSQLIAGMERGNQGSVSETHRSFRWLKAATASCSRPRELHYSQPLLHRLEPGVVVIGFRSIVPWLLTRTWLIDLIIPEGTKKRERQRLES